MAYTKTNWLDRAVQFATRYLKSGETSSGVTLTADPGTVTQAGTPVNADNLNKLEQGVYDAHTTADGALQRSGGTMTGNLGISNTAPIITLTETDQSNKNWYIVTDGGNFSIRETNLGTERLAISAGGDWIYKSNILPQMRSINGYVEWNNGGVWQPMGDMPVGKARTATAPTVTNNVYATVVNITGVYGRLEAASLLVGVGTTGNLRVTIDGGEDIISYTNSGGSQAEYNFLNDSGSGVGAPITSPILFYNSLKIEVMAPSGAGTFTSGKCTYRLKSGTA